MSNKGLPKHKRARGEDAPDLPAAPVKTKLQRTRGGRPSLYDEEKIRQACLIARLGGTDLEIAEACKVSPATVYNYFNQFPAFLEAVKVGRDMADGRVERSLYKRATGYSLQTEKIFSNGFRAIVTEHVPPDTGAAIFILKNRKRLEWADRRETELIVPESTTTPEQADNRQLALAALALMSEAAYDDDSNGPTIEAMANTEEQDDGEEADYADVRGQQDSARGDDGWGDEEAPDIDPFDLDD